jgi:DNA adenine methylase
MKVLVPPVKCQGIKTKVVPWILENAQANRSGRWIEPFLGSGVVGFNARHVNGEFGDINPHIIAFYGALKSSEITPKLVRQFLEYEGERLRRVGEEHYYAVRERFNSEKDPLDFLFLSRSCFNGVIRFNNKGEFNVPFCRKPDRFSRAYVTKIVNQVSWVYELLSMMNWRFWNRDFRDLIAEADGNDFIYCDPPYFGRHVDYFSSWSEQDEHDLFASLSTTRARFILSTWHSNKYRVNKNIMEYWKNFFILTKEHFYHIGAKEENRNSMLEALVLNYRPPASSVGELRERQLVLLEPKASYSASR